jgi:hypothetical protein
MLYLLDANVLITAERDYYAMGQVPEYWEWIVHMATEGSVKLPQEIIFEVLEGGKDKDKDPLLAWLKHGGVQDSLTLLDEVMPHEVQSVVKRGYAPDLTDSELEEVGRDPFLVAYALHDSKGRMIVTTEVSKPSRKRQNRHLPDVCRDLGVMWCDTFAMNRALGFRTDWKTGL